MKRTLSCILCLSISIVVSNGVVSSQDLVPFPIVAYGGDPYLITDNLNIATAGFNVRLGDDIAGAWANGIKSIVGVSSKPWVNAQGLNGRYAYEADQNRWAFGAPKNKSHDMIVFFDYNEETPPINYIGDHKKVDITTFNGLAVRVSAAEGSGTVIENFNFPYKDYMRPQGIAEADVNLDGNISFQTQWNLKVTDHQVDNDVIKIYIDTNNVRIDSLVIQGTDFSASNAYQTFSLDYDIPVNRTKVQMKFGVYSYGTVDFYVDRITGSDENYDHLTAGGWDTDMNNFINTNTSGGNDTLVLGWYLTDEPKYPVYNAQKEVYGYMNNPMRSAPKPGMQAINHVKLAYEAARSWKPELMMYDNYPFNVLADQITINNQNDNVAPSNMDTTRYFQNEIYNFLNNVKGFYDTTVVATSDSVKEYWGIVQSHGFFLESWQCKLLRMPEPEEIRLQAYLYLAYGVKGLAFFRYASNNYGDDNSNVDSTLWYGSLSDCNSIPATSLPDSLQTESALIYGLVNNTSGSWEKSQIKQWDEVQDLNSDLIKVGPVFRELTWLGAYTHYWDSPLSGGVVQSVSSLEYGDNSFIEVSEYSHPSGDKYFMLVNRRVKSTETQTLTVTLEQSGSRRLIEDVLASRKTWDNDPDRVAYRIRESGIDTFTVNLKPGEGRLFRVSTAGLSGSADSDKYWSGEVWVGGNYTISDSAKLEIYPGVTTKFTDNARLKVVGQLDAVGTSGSLIKFKSINASPTAGDWYGIEIDHTSGSGRKSTLKYCDIKHAAAGVTARSVNDSLEVSNTAFSLCQFGIYANNSDLDIKSNSFNGSSGGQYGVFIQSATTNSLIYNNNIDNYRTTAGYGIYSNASSPVIGYNDITNNLKDGLYSTGSGHPKVYRGYTNGGENTITNNSRTGVYATGGSYPFIGKLSFQPGNNCIKLNSSYEVANYNTSGMIYAAYNGWNYFSGPPSWEIYGSVYTANPFYCGIPLGLNMLENLYKEFASLFTITPEPALALQVSLTGDLNAAEDKMFERDFVNALPILKRIVRDFPEAKESEYALSLITEALRGVSNQSALEAYLELNIQNGNNTKSERYSKRLLVREYEKGKNFTKSENLAKGLLSSNPTAEEKKDMLFELATLNLFGKNNHSEAAKYFRQIIAAFPEDDIAEVAQSHLDVFVNESGMKKSVGSGTNVPKEYYLEQNYPNPFNAVTKIRFGLPEGGNVKLIVYNIIGQEVARLIDRGMSAGKHEVSWDASTAASGIYIYRLRAGDFVQTMKMALLK